MGTILQSLMTNFIPQQQRELAVAGPNLGVANQQNSALIAPLNMRLRQIDRRTSRTIRTALILLAVVLSARRYVRRNCLANHPVP